MNVVYMPFPPVFTLTTYGLHESSVTLLESYGRAPQGCTYLLLHVLLWKCLADEEQDFVLKQRRSVGRCARVAPVHKPHPTPQTCSFHEQMQPRPRPEREHALLVSLQSLPGSLLGGFKLPWVAVPYALLSLLILIIIRFTDTTLVYPDVGSQGISRLYVEG